MRLYGAQHNGPRKPVGEYSGEFGQRLAKLTDDVLDEMASPKGNCSKRQPESFSNF